MLSEIRRHPRLWGLISAVAVGILLFLALLRVANQSVIVAFLDVGQGDAIFIQGPSGNQILYDAGPPSGAVLRELGKIMPFWDRSIDVVIMSHPDLDHSGGIPEVIRRYDVDLLLEPGKFSGNGAYEAVHEAVEQRGVDLLEARRGMRIELGGDAYADILYPTDDVSAIDPNDASVVLRFVHDETSAILSGDLSASYESRLALTYGDGLRSNILKLGHHGSRTSSGELWLAATSPDISVISSGRENRYGHPHQEVLDRLANLGIDTMNTADEGTIVFRSDGIRFLRVK